MARSVYWALTGWGTESLGDLADFSKNVQTHSSMTTSLTINVPVVYMVRYKVVLRGDYP